VRKKPINGSLFIPRSGGEAQIIQKKLKSSRFGGKGTIKIWLTKKKKFLERFWVKKSPLKSLKAKEDASRTQSEL